MKDISINIGLKMKAVLIAVLLILVISFLFISKRNSDRASGIRKYDLTGETRDSEEIQPASVDDTQRISILSPETDGSSSGLPPEIKNSLKTVEDINRINQFNIEAAGDVKR